MEWNTYVMYFIITIIIIIYSAYGNEIRAGIGRVKGYINILFLNQNFTSVTIETTNSV